MTLQVNSITPSWLIQARAGVPDEQTSRAAWQVSLAAAEPSMAQVRLDWLRQCLGAAASLHHRALVHARAFTSFAGYQNSAGAAIAETQLSWQQA